MPIEIFFSVILLGLLYVVIKLLHCRYLRRREAREMRRRDEAKEIERKAKQTPADLRRERLVEKAIKGMGISCYTAVMRGIAEGPGTEEEKQIMRQKFLDAGEMTSEDFATVDWLKASAKKHPNIKPWSQ